MMSTNSKQILNNLYGLMLEINYHREDQEILLELEQKPDLQINNHLVKIRQLTAKLKAEATKARYADALDQLKKLKEQGIEEFKKMFSINEQANLIPMFNKFTELSKKDEEAILEDQEMLQFMSILKERTDETTSDD
ncbi:hypothetical protein [Pedobacter sp. MR22-3]|uniref:hypothetical protein n=2 Tax=unclassified Pedobacter TaxID=2628915 RepID=UPI002246B26B|nr:hypothetical protein [Pedobacter sp. MR22-3]MCX2584352.1 hypothetical protein [Pedobacter sp. MR22-3]